MTRRKRKNTSQRNQRRSQKAQISRKPGFKAVYGDILADTPGLASLFAELWHDAVRKRPMPTDDAWLAEQLTAALASKDAPSTGTETAIICMRLHQRAWQEGELGGAAPARDYERDFARRVRTCVIYLLRTCRSLTVRELGQLIAYASPEKQDWHLEDHLVGHIETCGQNDDLTEIRALLQHYNEHLARYVSASPQAKSLHLRVARVLSLAK